jgi:hypothetical protein
MPSLHVGGEAEVMTAGINARVEKALREAMGHVAHAEADQITASLARLDGTERLEALGLSVMITCYAMVAACGSQWPDDGDARQIANDLATTGTAARRLQLDAGQIYAYLSRTVLGSDLLEDVIPDAAKAACTAIIVAQRAVGVYAPSEMDSWDYLDQIESAIEVASALDASVLPAAVMRVYLPGPKTAP